MIPILAAAAGSYSIVQLIIAALVIGGALAVLFLALKHFGITIPPVIIAIFWVVVVVAVAIVAVKFIAGL